VNPYTGKEATGDPSRYLERYNNQGTRGCGLSYNPYDFSGAKRAVITRIPQGFTEAKGVNMDMPAEELTDAEIENLFAKGVVRGDTKRFLWHVGTGVAIGFLAALLLGLSGVPLL
jgi:hypothetical protein